MKRRMERRLADDYIALVDEFCNTLDASSRAIALELARLPEQIRGFGHVKERSVLLAEQRRGELLQRYRAGS